MGGIVTPAWLQAVRRQNAQIVTLVQIDTDASTSFKFTRSSGKVLGFPNSVDDYVPISHRIDPFTRELGAGQITVRFNDDGHLRRINKDFRVKGKRIIMKLGEASLAEGAYLPLFKGVIEDSPLPRDGNILELPCRVAYLLLRDEKITGYWINRHPTQIIRDILSAANVPVELIDTASLDPDNFPTAISHYNTARSVHGSDDRTIREPVEAFKLAGEVGQLLIGGLAPTEEGKLKFVRYDPTVAVNDTWPVADIDKFVVKQVATNLTNQVGVDFNWDGEGDSGNTADRRIPNVSRFERRASHRDRFDCTDTTSAANHAYPGLSTNSYEQVIYTKWLGVRSRLNAAITGSPTTFELKGGYLSSFCGLRGEDDSGASFAGLTASRTAFIKIENEIIEVDAVVAGTDSEVFDPEVPDSNTRPEQLDVRGGTTDGGGTHDGSAPAGGSYINIDTAVFTVKTRGAFGSTAVDHPKDAEAIDYTIAIDLARGLVGRFSDGVAILEVTTPLHRFDSQIGDLIALTDETFSKFGFDGVDPATKWEIVGKEVVAHGASPQIVWTLAEARTPPAFTEVCSFFTTKGGATIDKLDDNILGSDVLDGHVIGGNDLEDTGVLGDILVRLGNSNKLGKWSRAQDTTITSIASRDHYIGIDQERHGICSDRVTVAAAEPATGFLETRIGKVETNGSNDIVGTPTDLRSTTRAVASTDILGGAAKIWNGAFSVRRRNIAQFPPEFVEIIDGKKWGVGNDAEINTSVSGTPFAGDASILVHPGGGIKLGDHIPVDVKRPYVAEFRWTTFTSGGAARGDIDWFDENRRFLASTNVFNFAHSKVGILVTSRDRVLPPTTPDISRFARLRFTNNGATEDVHIDSWGLKEIPISFRAVQTVSQSVGAGSVKISFDTTDHNDGGHYSTTLDRFVAPEDGIYQFQSQVQLVSQNPNNEDVCILSLRLNATVDFVTSHHYCRGIKEPGSRFASPPIFMFEDDFVEVFMSHQLGGGFRSTNNIPRITWFGGSQIA